MNVKEQIDAWLEEIWQNFRPLLRGLSDQARRDFIAEELVKRLKAACDDPEFKKQYARLRAEETVTDWLEYREPEGRYDPEDMLPLGGEIYKQMQFASRENLIQWRAVLVKDPDKGIQPG